MGTNILTQINSTKDVYIKETQLVIDEVNLIRDSNYDFSQIKKAREKLESFKNSFNEVIVYTNEIEEIINCSIKYVDKIIESNMIPININGFYKIEKNYQTYFVHILDVSTSVFSQDDSRYYKARVIYDNTFTLDNYFDISPYCDISIITEEFFKTKFSELINIT